MIGRTNEGGGLANAFAAIAVTYPAGSTCTCTNGTKTLRAKDTSGSCLFSIPEAGTWTVTARSGGKSASKSVSITKQYHAEALALSYELFLIQNGIIEPGYTLNPTAYFTQQESNVRFNISGGAAPRLGHIAPMVDATQYDTLHIEGRNQGGSTGEYRIGLKSDTSVNNSLAACDIGNYVFNGTDYEANVDITALSGNFYFAIYSTSGSNAANFYFTKVVLS